MAKTLLDGTNELLKRVGVVAGVLTSLTDSARQVSIDQAVQVINEGIDELYSSSGKPLPSQQKQGTVTLATGTRGYALASDLVRLRWPLIDKTNNQMLVEHPGGYNAMLTGDTEQNDTGLPMLAAIRETDGYLHLDRAPTSVENGRIYTYQYDRDMELDDAADEVPFSNIVFRAMVPVWVQLWKREMRREFDEVLYRQNVGRAARLMTQATPRTQYSPRG